MTAQPKKRTLISALTSMEGLSVIQDEVSRCAKPRTTKRNDKIVVGVLVEHKEVARRVKEIVCRDMWGKIYKDANEKYINVPQFVEAAAAYINLIDVIRILGDVDTRFYTKEYFDEKRKVETRYKDHYELKSKYRTNPFSGKSKLDKQQEQTLTRDEYLMLSKLAHPDTGGSNEAMQALTRLYDKDVARLQAKKIDAEKVIAEVDIIVSAELKAIDDKYSKKARRDRALLDIDAAIADAKEVL